MKKHKPQPIDAYFIPPDIHVVQREEKGGIFTLIVAVILLFVDSMNLYFVLAGKIQPIVGMLWHIVLVALAGAYTKILMTQGRENRFAFLLLLTFTVLGPFGAGGMIIALVMHFWYLRRAQPFEEWYETIFPSISSSRSQQIYSDIVVGRDETGKKYSIIPFMDVLGFGSENQKRQALAKMTSHFDPSFAPAFRKALNDPSNTIRVQAATAITKIENGFLAQLMKLSALKDKHPNDPVVAKAIAEHYDNYAYTGLLDADREKVNREKALECYTDYLHAKPHDVEVRARIGRIHMRNKDYASAAQWLKQCLDQGYHSDTIAVWYAESLYAGGKFAELRQYIGSTQSFWEQFVKQPSALADAIKCWLGHHQPVGKAA